MSFSKLSLLSCCPPFFLPSVFCCMVKLVWEFLVVLRVLSISLIIFFSVHGADDSLALWTQRMHVIALPF